MHQSHQPHRESFNKGESPRERCPGSIKFTDNINISEVFSYSSKFKPFISCNYLFWWVYEKSLKGSARDYFFRRGAHGDVVCTKKTSNSLCKNHIPNNTRSLFLRPKTSRVLPLRFGKDPNQRPSAAEAALDVSLPVGPRLVFEGVWLAYASLDGD